MPKVLVRLLRWCYRAISSPPAQVIEAALVQAPSRIEDANQPRTERASTPELEAASPIELASAITHLYRLALNRTPGEDERQAWVQQILGNRMSVAQLVDVIATSSEAESVRRRANVVPDVSNGRFILFAYEHLLERGPMASEIAYWDHQLRQAGFNRSELIVELFRRHANEKLANPAQQVVQDPNLAPWMGRGGFVSSKEWLAKAEAVGSDYPPVVPQRYSSLQIRSEPKILVSAIASLYRGGDYIEQLLENVTSQSIFTSHCELIIIDAASPEDEAATIHRYIERFPNIVYHRASTRIGIYDAWNLGVQMARGKYLTNTNLDDLRRTDSLERQAEILEKFHFVDITYQDFFYSFDGKAPFAKSAAVGIRSQLPVVTPYNLLMSNSPHNAPMWRRELHDELGMFDTGFRSAGDYDFWLRCREAGKTFFKLNDPHVIYFVNPEGLSTQPNTRGNDEVHECTKRHSRNLLSRHLLSSDNEFLNELSNLVGTQIGALEGESANLDWRYRAAQRALRLHATRSQRHTKQV